MAGDQDPRRLPGIVGDAPPVTARERTRALVVVLLTATIVVASIAWFTGTFVFHFPTTIPLAGCGGVVGGPSPACSHGPTGAPGGLSQDAAIAAAVKVAPPVTSGALTVVWASIEPDPFAPPGGGDRPLVWEVRVSGSLGAPACPSGFLDRPATSSDTPCLDTENGIIAVLDYFSGVLIGWLH